MPALKEAVLGSPLARLLVQLIVIVVAARVSGALFRAFRQPAVVGEIVAGILLGPSVFGAVAPGAFQAVFGSGSLSALKLFAEVGVLLFLFVVGLDLDLSFLSERAATTVAVSLASIAVPFVLGVGLGLTLRRELAPPSVASATFALFLGVALSITAFPVLARILAERGMLATRLGSTALACAAANDAAAWSLLVVVVAMASRGDVAHAALTLAWALAFGAFLVVVVRPLLRRFFARRDTEKPDRSAMATVVVVLLGSALATEAIGIHALFGAFLAGAVMPRKAHLKDALVERLEELSSVLLVPVFFAFTGLRTSLALLGDTRGWALCGLIVAVAAAGKLGGVFAAARLSGLPAAEAFTLGALMNTRGLMELIALNVGYELGILSPRTFSMLVLMALATTLATGPLLSLSERWRLEGPNPAV